VIGRDVDIDKSEVRIEGIIFDAGNPAGYAPCVRVDSLLDVDGVVAARNYLGPATSTTDYANSDSDAYAQAGFVRNDGGVGWFVEGGKVRLILRDDTTLETQDLTIDSIAPASSGDSTITFTTPVNATFQAYIAADRIVDLIPQTYASLIPSQTAFAAVSAGTILDGTSDDAKTFSP
jgi:hypothetical protein